MQTSSPSDYTAEMRACLAGTELETSRGSFTACLRVCCTQVNVQQNCTILETLNGPFLQLSTILRQHAVRFQPPNVGHRATNR
jgi:hypothetical protein